VILLDLVFEIWESEIRNTKTGIRNAKKERAQPGFIAESAMEKRLAVPPQHGPKNETPRGIARRSTEREYYIAAIMRIQLKSSGQKGEGQKP
jgi:hypothetical protein